MNRMNVNQIELLLSVQRALLFSVTPNIRLIFIEMHADDSLKMLAYVDSEPTEDELDLLYSAAGEVCGDFVGLNESDVQFIVSAENFESLKKLKHLVYARAE